VTASLTIGGPLFKPPRALTDPEIRQIIAQFTSAARIAAEAGFAGVQIHAAHGYLLSQFLSPLVNQRTDQWGGSVQNRMRMLIEVLRAVKSLTPEAFLLTVKMNVSDCQSGGFDADDALIVAQALENEGVHLIEFSGGTYESSAMIDGGPARDQSGAPEPYFLAYAQRFARELTVPVMLSGEFRSRTAMIDAVESGAADVIGLARPIAVEPDFPVASSTALPRSAWPSHKRSATTSTTCSAALGIRSRSLGWIAASPHCRAESRS
jgi:2,4-dienoyl-CoA reductase-like NADH-dependent reductase (Old Yellow Enzyme family)